MLLLSLTLCSLAVATPGDAPPARAPAQTETVQPARSVRSLDELLDALRRVETGGVRQGGRQATGDGGSAIGPFQIHRGYWMDTRLPGRFEDCRDPEYARKVVIAYWKRYCPKALEALDAETLARVHNGGPDGHKEAATLRFWRKVQREIESARAKEPAPPAATPSTPAPAAPPAARPKAPSRPELV
jgi:hypothetical protein